MFTHDGDPELQEIPREECLQLVAGMEVGRLAVGRGDRAPLVVPVNFVLDGEDVVFRSDPGTKLDVLRSGSPVSFQVDQYDFAHRRGWSVLISGMPREVPPGEVDHLPVTPWAGGDKLHWIRISPRVVTGRRIQLPEIQQDNRGYL